MDSSNCKLFQLPKEAFQRVLDGLDTEALHSFGAAAILGHITGEKMDMIILEDARRHREYVVSNLSGTYNGPYKSLLEFAIRGHQPTAVIEHDLDLYAEEFPEYIEYSHMSPLIDQIIDSESINILELLINKELAPSIADNGDTYMSKAIASRSVEVIFWLVKNGQDFTSFLFPLDRRGMLQSGTPLYDYLKEFHKDTLNGYVPKAERQQ
ncbi:hypothetical protein Hte_010264 [Hypoxylon texense]